MMLFGMLYDQDDIGGYGKGSVMPPDDVMKEKLVWRHVHLHSTAISLSLATIFTYSGNLFALS